VNVNLEFTAWLPMLPTVPWPPRIPDTGVDPIQERHVRRLLFPPGRLVRARNPDPVSDLPAGLARFLRAAAWAAAHPASRPRRGPVRSGHL